VRVATLNMVDCDFAWNILCILRIRSIAFVLIWRPMNHDRLGGGERLLPCLRQGGLGPLIRHNLCWRTDSSYVLLCCRWVLHSLLLLQLAGSHPLSPDYFGN